MTSLAGRLACPKCTRAFLIGPDFVMDIAATGRVHRNCKRAEVRCHVCSHAWWSKHPEAFRRARAVRASSEKYG